MLNHLLGHNHSMSTLEASSQGKNEMAPFIVPSTALSAQHSPPCNYDGHDIPSEVGWVLSVSGTLIWCVTLKDDRLSGGDL